MFRSMAVFAASAAAAGARGRAMDLGEWNSITARSRARPARSGLEAVRGSKRESKRRAELVNQKQHASVR